MTTFRITNASNITDDETARSSMMLFKASGVPPQVRLREVSWTFILPVICAIGMSTQALNIVVFSRLKKDRLNKYCLVHSISYFFYTLICMFSFLIRCGSLCNVSSTYGAKFYEYIVFNYLTSVLAIFSIMIETRLSFERYLTKILTIIALFVSFFSIFSTVSTFAIKMMSI